MFLIATGLADVKTVGLNHPRTRFYLVAEENPRSLKCVMELICNGPQRFILDLKKQEPRLTNVPLLIDGIVWLFTAELYWKSMDSLSGKYKRIYKG